MKHLLILLTMLVLVRCEPPNQSMNTLKFKKTKETYGLEYKYELTEITYEGCTYIGQFKGYCNDWGTHKGTCTNPIHTK